MAIVRKLVIIIFILGMIGCSSTKQSENVVHSGFLKDYSILRKGEGGEASLVYKNPIAEWNTYTKVIVEPVQVWMGKNSPFHQVPREERLALATRLQGVLSDKLRADYRIVREPGRDVMRVSVALTEAESSRIMGSASVEAKITDSVIGNLLVAAVDRRRGAISPTGGIDRWRDVEASFQYWASLLRYRLCQWRGQRLCEEPQS